MALLSNKYVVATWRCRRAAFVVVLHLCLHLIPVAVSRHTTPSAVPKTSHHVGASVTANCSGGTGKVAVKGWKAANTLGAYDYGAREYLSAVEVFWNEADAFFPVYRHAVVLFGGRGSSGSVKSDAWMIPLDSSTPRGAPTFVQSNATLIHTHGEAPALWGHTAVWTGRGSDKAETWPTPRTYAGVIDGNDDLVSAQGHPLQDLRHTISGKLQSWNSTIAPCVGGNTIHKHTSLPCSSSHGKSGGCSCVQLQIQSRTKGVLDADTRINDVTSPLYPSVWSGRRIEIIAGPGRGYQGFISYNSDDHVYNVAPAIDFQVGLVHEDTSHFVITEAEALLTNSVPLDTMWVFGGYNGELQLSNKTYALTTAMPDDLDGVLAAAANDYQYSSTGVEDYTRSTHGWFYNKTEITDFGSPERPTQGPRDEALTQRGPPETSVCGEYGSILGGYKLLGPDTVLSKTYITSAPHNVVRITFDFIKIDFWDGQFAELSVDGQAVWSRQFRSNTTSKEEKQVCGRDDPPGFRGENIVQVNLTVPHISPSVELSFRLDKANGTSRDSWWGLRKMHVRTLPSGFTWREVADKGDKPPARVHHAAAQYREMMYVFGGSTAATVPSVASDPIMFTNFSSMNDSKLGDLYVFNTTSETWAVISAQIAEQARELNAHSASMPVARSHHTFVKGRGDSLMLYGGQAQSGLFISDVHVLQAREHLWETAITLGQGPGARAGHGSATSGGRMWVYGGYRMDIASRNVKLEESVYYLDLHNLIWHEASPSKTASAVPMRYGFALVTAPGGAFAIVGGATATPRAGLPGIFPSGTPIAPAMDISFLHDAHIAQLECVQTQTGGDVMLQHRSQLTCNSMGEIDWLRVETAKLQQQMSIEVMDLEMRLTAAYLAAAERNDQYSTDREWLDLDVTTYTDKVAQLVEAGQIYTDQMAFLSQARRNRAEMEIKRIPGEERMVESCATDFKRMIQYVFYKKELEGRKLALHMQLDITRQRYEKAIERLENREAVVTRRKAEGAVSAGTQHSCAVNAQDRIQCWGLNDIHQSDPPANLSFRAVTAGDHQTCGIRMADGGIQCWGTNSFGKGTPPPIQAGNPFTEISAGGGHVCGVQKNGQVTCFGDNRQGQCNTPKDTGGQFVMVSAGYAHTCALRAVDAAGMGRRQGRIECWGMPADLRTKPPTGIFKWVSAGGRHSCAVDLQGHVHCWGSNSHLQIVAPRSTFSTVTAGHLHTCGIRSNGDAECWGSNVHGQVKVPPKRRWQALSAGYEHSCGIDALRHQVVCWGKMVRTPDVPTCARVWVQ